LSLTHGGNDLRLQSELVAETSSKVADSSFAISSSVLDLPDVVEHVSAGEQKNSNQTDRSP
jgi:hypothetical protein